jgi:hypothetical protein
MHVGELLGPLVGAMRRALLTAPYIQADETPVPVQMHDRRGENHQAYLWQYGKPGSRLLPEERAAFFSHLGVELEKELAKGQWWPLLRMLSAFEPHAWQAGTGAQDLRLLKWQRRLALRCRPTCGRVETLDHAMNGASRVPMSPPEPRPQRRTSLCPNQIALGADRPWPLEAIQSIQTVPIHRRIEQGTALDLAPSTARRVRVRGSGWIQRARGWPVESTYP